MVLTSEGWEGWVADSWPWGMASPRDRSDGTGGQGGVGVNLYLSCPSPTCPSSAEWNCSAAGMGTPICSGPTACVVSYSTVTSAGVLVRFSASEFWEAGSAPLRQDGVVAASPGWNCCLDAKKYLGDCLGNEVGSCVIKTLQERVVSRQIPSSLAPSTCSSASISLSFWHMRFIFILGCHHLSRKMCRKWHIHDRLRNATWGQHIHKRQPRKLGFPCFVSTRFLFLY